MVFERGPYVSFANCGLPYFVGDVIKDEKDLLVASAELFRKRFNIEVRTEHEVVSIDRAAKEIEVRDLQTDGVVRERYDALVLAPGAERATVDLDEPNHVGVERTHKIDDPVEVAAGAAKVPAPGKERTLVTSRVANVVEKETHQSPEPARAHRAKTSLPATTFRLPVGKDSTDSAHFCRGRSAGGWARPRRSPAGLL